MAPNLGPYTVPPWLEQLERAVKDDGRRVILVPPRHGKTELMNRLALVRANGAVGPLVTK